MNQYIEKNINEIIELIKREELESAKIKIEILINQNIKNDVIYNLMGIVNLKSKSYTLAIKYFKKSLKINKNFSSALLNLAISQKELNKNDDAIKNLKKVVSINPGHYEVWLEIGLLYFKEKKYSQAIFFFLESKKINNKFDKAYYNLGLTYFNLKNYSASIKNLKEAIKINTRFSDAYYYLGESYRKLKKFDESMQSYKLSSHKKKDYKILQCMLENGNKDKYAKKLNEIIKINPNDRRIASLAEFASNELFGTY